MKLLSILPLVLSMAATSNAPDAQWKAGDMLPDLFLPDVRVTRDAEGPSSPLVSLQGLVDRPTLLLEFASW